ncbi:MAG: hypothetical protein RBS38_04805 [Bacteroidales bacterium]|jgi:hypothetical protein|nr:hypothetical protein [Bacteroidales bacterium]
MKSNWIRKIIGGMSLTTAMFIFQACYGTPQDMGLDMLVEGQVKSLTSGLPVKGIKVSVVDYMQYDITDETGKFSFYAEMIEGIRIQFQDIDANENGLFADKDTVLTAISEKVYLDIMLENK